MRVFCWNLVQRDALDATKRLFPFIRGQMKKQYTISSLLDVIGDAYKRFF